MSTTTTGTVKRLASWLRDNGITAWAIFEVVSTLVTKKEPHGDALKVVKTIHTGLFSANDEIIFSQICHDELSDDGVARKEIERFIDFIRKGYGDGPTGTALCWEYLNHFRIRVIKMKGEPKMVKLSESKDPKTKVVTTEKVPDPAFVSGSVKFLNRMATTIATYRQQFVDDGKNAEEAQTLACTALLTEFKRDSFPTPRFFDSARKADEAIGTKLAAVKSAGAGFPETMKERRNVRRKSWRRLL